MKNLIKSILCASSVIYLFACNGGNPKELEHEEILIDNISVNNIDIENLFDSIKFISLDENDVFIPGAAKIIYKNDSIYISDGFKIYISNTKGEIVRIMNKKGRANDEYLEITDFDVTNSNIIVLDRNNRNILIYDKNLKFISKINLNVFASTFASQNDSLLILNNDYSSFEDSEKGKLTKININNNEISYLGEFNRNRANYMHILGGFNFYSNNSALYFYEKFSPYVYKIDNGEMILNKDIHFYNTPEDEYYNRDFSDIAEFLDDFNLNKYASGVSNFYCSDYRIIFKFDYDKMAYYCSYNREEKQVDFLGRVYLYDSIAINNIYFHDNKAIFSISAYRLIDAMKTNKKIADLVKKHNITEKSNPLLLLTDYIK